MDGSPACVRTAFKELNGNLSAFGQTGLKNQGVSPIHRFQRNFNIYSPATELSYNLNELSTNTPNNKENRFKYIVKDIFSFYYHFI